MKYFLFMCLLLGLSVQGADLSHLKEIESGKLIYGEAVKTKDLKGKVILFEYWGIN